MTLETYLNSRLAKCEKSMKTAADTSSYLIALGVQCELHSLYLLLKDGVFDDVRNVLQAENTGTAGTT